MKCCNHFYFFVLFTLLLPAVRVNASPADSVINDRTRELIWALELTYFTSLYKADYEGVILLTDTLFLGWPGSVTKPMDRDESSRFMKKLIPGPSVCKIAILRQGIRISEATALTQYLLQVSCVDDKGKPHIKTTRISHTWVKRSNGWKLLGGMSAEQEKE